MPRMSVKEVLMSDLIRTLREELARHVSERRMDSPRVEHLRWQLASVERVARRAASVSAPIETPHGAVRPYRAWR